MSRRPFVFLAVLLGACLVALPACKKKRPTEDEGGGGGGGGVPVPGAPPAVSSDLAVFAHLDARQIYSNPLFADAKSAVAKSGGTGAWDKVDADAGKEFGVRLTDIETATVAVTEAPAQGEPKMVIILTSKAPFRKDGAFGLKPGTAPDSRGFHKSGGGMLVHFPDAKTAVAVSAALADKYLAGYAQNRAGWPLTADLTRAAAGHLAFAAINVAQLSAAMPAGDKQELGSLLSAQKVVVTADLKGKELSVGARATFPDAASAVQAQNKVLEFVKMASGAVDQFAGGRELADFPSLKPAVTEAQRAVKNVRIDVSGSDVTLAASYAANFDAAQMIAEAIKKAEGASGRIAAQNNLKQITLGLHNYHDAMGSLPVHAVGAMGPLRNPTDKPLLSWRVAILPYIEQDNLYKQFRMNEPWDSAHNKALVAQMPKVYAPVEKPGQPGKTHLQMVVGAGGMSPFGSRLHTIPDGTSNTIAVIETADAVEWTKPADVTLPPKPAPGALKKLFGGQFPGGFNVAMWDGSVRFIPDTVSERTLQLLFDPRDGMVIPADWMK